MTGKFTRSLPIVKLLTSSNTYLPARIRLRSCFNRQSKNIWNMCVFVYIYMYIDINVYIFNVYI